MRAITRKAVGENSKDVLDHVIPSVSHGSKSISREPSKRVKMSTCISSELLESVRDFVVFKLITTGKESTFKEVTEAAFKMLLAAAEEEYGGKIPERKRELSPGARIR